MINRNSTENQSSGANTSYTTMEELFNKRLVHIFLLSEALVFSETDFEYQNKCTKLNKFVQLVGQIKPINYD